MSSSNIESRIEELIKPSIEKLNYDLYDVQYLKEGKDYYLRITIDSENGINIDDCENVNNAIDDIIDEADFIKESYYLEVSSPGIERVLRKAKHFEKQINNEIYLKLFKSINEKKEFTGILQDYNEDVLHIKVDDEILEINVKDIAIAKTISEEI